MKNHELLVPAGDMDCLYQAVYNGADAVYLACQNFGARKFAKNFTNEEMISAIRFCHLYGVRIYVTMNTLVKNTEVDSFLEQVRFLHKNGVDALIVQDFGMICLIREMFPNLEIHASTQANICSREVCELYHEIGVKRVVFARELSIDEIDSIDVDIEKEAFIHGALCISYSGECLMSSMLGGRSGNRGECAGVCRMPFSLEKDGKVISKNQYLLSTKELNTSSEMKRLLSSSIDSFKIEGRMKSPLYVGFITRFYRRLIDGEEFDLEEETNQLKTIFNREFTVGRIFSCSDSDLMNTKSPNHIGLEIGKVIDITSDKIKIQLNKELHQNDAIRFLSSNQGFIVNYLYDQSGKLVSSAKDICFVDNKVGLETMGYVSKTYDSVLEKSFEKVERKIDVSFDVIAREGEVLKVVLTDGVFSFLLEGDIVEAAKSSPISKESIKQHLCKLGNTPFECQSFSIRMDSNIFIPVRSLNEIRRRLVEKLVYARENRESDYLEKKVVFDRKQYPVCSGKIHCSVMSEEQLKTCLSLEVDRIYVPRNLYSKYKDNSKIFLMMERCSFHPISSLEERVLVSDYFNGYQKIGNYPLNVMNIYTAYYLQKYGYSEICLSVELSSQEVFDFTHLYQEKFGDYSFEVFSYGRVENMIVKGNILNLDQNDSYYLVDSKKRSFPVYYDGHITHIFNYQCQNLDVFVGNSRLDFYRESSQEIKKIVKKYQLMKRNY